MRPFSRGNTPWYLFLMERCVLRHIFLRETCLYVYFDVKLNVRYDFQGKICLSTYFLKENTMGNPFSKRKTCTEPIYNILWHMFFKRKHKWAPIFEGKPLEPALRENAARHHGVNFIENSWLRFS